MTIPAVYHLEKFSGAIEHQWRYYLTVEEEKSCNWKIKVQNKVIFPVRKGALAQASKVINKMLAENPTVTTEPLVLDCDSDTSSVLALMRFIHHPDTLNTDSMEALLKLGYVSGLLKLAHKLECTGFLEKLVALIGECQAILFDSCIVDLIEAAKSINFDRLATLCLEAISKKIATAKNLSGKKAAALIDKLGTSPDLLKAALAVALVSREAKEDVNPPAVKALQEWFEEEDSFLPAAVHTYRLLHFKIRVISNELHNQKLEWFTYHNLHFQLGVWGVKNSRFHITLKMKDPPPVELSKVAKFTVRIVNPEAPHESKILGPFEHGFNKQGHEFDSTECSAKVPLTNELFNWTDANGTLILQVASFKIIDAALVE